ncbi:MAG: DoxX family protein [Gemmatimonadetes bacterium]|nr:MAG: DoxX family protein [Gemmatimonadota bacterium]PYP38687.1 MAG: DoxX family protein [Gemmatimonadota bacterium]
MDVTTTRSLVARWPALAPRLLSLFRIMLAFIFLQAGTMKLVAFPIGMPPNGGTAPLWSEFWVAGVLETVGGVLALLGLFTRPVAFIFAGEMAVAYFQFFAPQGFWPIATQGALPAICCFAWLYISAAGAGPWSLDARRRRDLRT